MSQASSYAGLTLLFFLFPFLNAETMHDMRRVWVRGERKRTFFSDKKMNEKSTLASSFEPRYNKLRYFLANLTNDEK
jgi:hypothetical protein